MSDSILTSTKKVLGVDANYTAFDVDILMHINSVFGTLAQLGIGPVSGYMISDADATWEDFLGEDLVLNPVKSYMYLRVRLLFDPPATSFAITAMQEQAKELEWRLSSHRESTHWVAPIMRPIDVYADPLYDPVIDGGVG